MNTLSVTPAFARRIASASVSRIVSGTGGQLKYASSPSRCAVGSPSVTMMTCLVARGCCESSRPGQVERVLHVRAVHALPARRRAGPRAASGARSR